MRNAPAPDFPHIFYTPAEIGARDLGRSKKVVARGTFLCFRCETSRRRKLEKNLAPLPTVRLRTPVYQNALVRSHSLQLQRFRAGSQTLAPWDFDVPRHTEQSCTIAVDARKPHTKSIVHTTPGKNVISRSCENASFSD